jgi:DNA-binding GntR family transcriptional regulator
LTATDQPQTVIRQSVMRLRDAIMLGDLRPGQKLIEADLCRDMGISRASLREALRALETERLVELVPNRGPSVAKLGWREIEEIHDVWSLLTGEAVYRFAGLATPSDIVELAATVKRLNQAVRARNALEQLAATNAFFGTIFDKCGNDVLLSVVYALVSRLNFLRAQAFQHSGWSERSAREIEDIVTAMSARGAGAARRATRRHIASACAAAKQVALQPRRPARQHDATPEPMRSVVRRERTRRRRA